MDNDLYVVNAANNTSAGAKNINPIRSDFSKTSKLYDAMFSSGNSQGNVETVDLGASDTTKKAIEVRALDYLLKPGSDEELVNVLEEAFRLSDMGPKDRDMAYFGMGRPEDSLQCSADSDEHVNELISEIQSKT